MKWLTKSNFNSYLVHPAKLWLAKHDPEKLPPWDEASEALAVQGRQIEAIARRRWSDGLMISGSLFDTPDITRVTAQKGIEVIFEGAVLTSRKLYAAADVLVKQPDETWDLYEIKSSTKVRDDQINDVAFQMAAFREAGWKMGRAYVMHVNGAYIRKGDINAAEFITVVEVTEAVNKRNNVIIEQISNALMVMAGPCPPLDVTLASDFYRWMDVMRFMHPNLPEHSVFNLTRLDAPLVKSLKARGIAKLSDIPVDLPELKLQQVTQLRAIAAGGRLIDAAGIAARLDTLEYPLQFLDYETASPAVPPFEGLAPYQQMPFQYSVHVQDSPTAKLRQYEFLAEGPDNPMGALVEQLRHDLSPTGSVIVWYKGFEMGRNVELGHLVPDSAEFFEQVNSRVFDLMEIFSEGLYADARFNGSASIKAVLPILVPELSYKSLGIQEGGAASRRWSQAARGELEDSDARRVYDDLLVYCRQDTLAMVKILEVLRALPVD
jgi:hypothetical protein